MKPLTERELFRAHLGPPERLAMLREARIAALEFAAALDAIGEDENAALIRETAAYLKARIAEATAN